MEGGDSEMSAMETTETGKGKRRLAFLDLLLHQHLVAKTLTLEDVKDEVDTFMFAGHDTTAMALAWTIYMLGIHQDVQERVREEVDSIFDASRIGSCDSSCPNNNNTKSTDKNEIDNNNLMSATSGSSQPTEDSSIPPLITEDMMRGMKYLDCVMKEVQRIYPTAPFIGRELTEDVTVCGYRVPAGTSAGILTFLLHQNPSIFPNPVKFDPDRFLPENSIGRHPYAYVPFSAGPRNCIGQKFALMEQKIVLSSLVREFIFSSVDPRDKLIVVGEMVLRPVNGIRVNIRPRWGDKGQSERPISPEGERRV
jgi:cytochrome P450